MAVPCKEHGQPPGVFLCERLVSVVTRTLRGHVSSFSRMGRFGRRSGAYSALVSSRSVIAPFTALRRPRGRRSFPRCELRTGNLRSSEPAAFYLASPFAALDNRDSSVFSVPRLLNEQTRRNRNRKAVIVVKVVCDIRIPATNLNRPRFAERRIFFSRALPLRVHSAR